MNRILLAALALATPLCAHAQRMSGSIDARRSTLTYAGHHPTHDWRATSKSVSGTVGVDPANVAGASVSIRVPVASFDSGNDSRDDHMIDVVKGDDNPAIVFTSERVVPTSWEQTADGTWAGLWQVTGKMQFAGQTVEMTLPVNVTLRGAALTASAQFSLSLAAFRIRPPALMGIAMRNNVELVAALNAVLH